MPYTVKADLHFLGFDVIDVVDEYDSETSVEAKDRFTQKFRRMRVRQLQERLKAGPLICKDADELTKHPENAMVLKLLNVEVTPTSLFHSSPDSFIEVKADRDLEDAWDDGAKEAVAKMKKALDCPRPHLARGTPSELTSAVMMPDGTVRVTGRHKGGQYRIINHEAVLVDNQGRIIKDSSPSCNATVQATNPQRPKPRDILDIL